MATGGNQTAALGADGSLRWWGGYNQALVPSLQGSKREMEQEALEGVSITQARLCWSVLCMYVSVMRLCAGCSG